MKIRLLLWLMIVVVLAGSGTTVTKATLPAPDDDNAPEARIIKVEKNVWLKKKQGTDFIALSKPALFRKGDTLRIGEGSRATAQCVDQNICELSTGEYTTCCTERCVISYKPPFASHRESKPFIVKEQLPSSERAIVGAAEQSIAALGLNEGMKQTLLFQLYSNWRLTDVYQAVDRLSSVAESSNGANEFGDEYNFLLRSLGTYYLEGKREQKAEVLLLKSLSVSQASGNEVEMANSYLLLGQFYQKIGRSKEAETNIDAAVKLYQKHGVPQGNQNFHEMYTFKVPEGVGGVITRQPPTRRKP